MRRVLTDFVSVMRELSLDGIREEAMLPPSLLVVGDASTRERIARDLFGAGASPYISFADAVPTMAGARFDAVAVIASGKSGSDLRRAIAETQGQGWPAVVLNPSTAAIPDEATLAEAVIPMPAGSVADWRGARERILDVVDENRWPALGRWVPELRPAVAAALIQATSRANAQFALLSNLPAFIPLVGNLVGATADFIILTKNQMLLLYKLAAVYGRDVDQRRQILMEMVPVVGAGLVWRTVARELVALLPALLGAVPKVMVAYAGTYTVGRAAQYYYEEGRRPTRADWDRFYRQAVARWQAMRAARGGRRRRVIGASAAEALPTSETIVETRSGQTVH